MLKVAVCISGMQRNTLLPIKDTLNTIHKAFPFADFYYHTWKNNILFDQVNLMLSDEPVLDYHPLYDNQDYIDYYKLYRKKYYNNKRWGSDDYLSKLKHANKQILAHAYVLDRIPAYDIIIRTRWDAWLSKKINYNLYIEEAYDADVPIGFETTFVKNIEKLDTSKQVLSLTDNIKFKKRLKDYMIIHKIKHFDTKKVYDLHHKKKLWSGEPGWYQIMSMPFDDHHRTYKNATWIIR